MAGWVLKWVYPVCVCVFKEGKNRHLPKDFGCKCQLSLNEFFENISWSKDCYRKKKEMVGKNGGNIKFNAEGFCQNLASKHKYCFISDKFVLGT